MAIVPTPKIVKQIIFALPILLLVCSPLGYLWGGPYISFFLAGFGIALLIARKLDRRPTILGVVSDENNLTLTWSNNEVLTIPWSEISKVEFHYSGVLTDTPRRLSVKRGSQEIPLGYAFAYDDDFVKKLKNHPALHKNKANDKSIG